MIQHPARDCARYPSSTLLKPRSLQAYSLPCLIPCPAIRTREHIMGVVVSEITIETRIAAERVIANSRNRRPMMPPISSSGMNTAISETLMEKTVKPISLRALKSRLHRRHSFFQMPRDVFHHDNRVVHHEAARDGQRHQRQIVQRDSRTDTSPRRCRSARPEPRRRE